MGDKNQIEFFKFQNNGNDFIIIDDLGKKPRKKQIKKIAKEVMQRGHSIGSNSVLYLCNSKKADAFMRIYGQTDIEGENCGNGCLCIGKYLLEKLKKKKIKLEILAGIVEIEKIKNGKIKAELGKVNFNKKIKVNIKGKKVDAIICNVGEPHLIIFEKNIDKIDLEELGSKVNKNKKNIINVDLVEKLGKNKIKTRFYECGCFEETLSCGTGSSCSAFFSKLGSKVEVKNKGGTLWVEFKEDKVYLIGKPEKVFKGILEVKK